MNNRGQNFSTFEKCPVLTTTMIVKNEINRSVSVEVLRSKIG
jgi:hypothetical protein